MFIMKPMDCQYSLWREICGATSLKRIDSTNAMGEFTDCTMSFWIDW